MLNSQYSLACTVNQTTLNYRFCDCSTASEKHHVHALRIGINAWNVQNYQYDIGISREVLQESLPGICSTTVSADEYC